MSACYTKNRAFGPKAPLWWHWFRNSSNPARITPTKWHTDWKCIAPTERLYSKSASGNVKHSQNKCSDFHLYTYMYVHNSSINYIKLQVCIFQSFGTKYDMTEGWQTWDPVVNDWLPSRLREYSNISTKLGISKSYNFVSKSYNCEYINTYKRKAL